MRSQFTGERPGGLKAVRLGPSPLLLSQRALGRGSDRIGPRSYDLLRLSPLCARVASEPIEQETARRLRASLERIKLRGISTLELIGDSELEKGLKLLSQAAAPETLPHPVIEEVNLVVFRRV